MASDARLREWKGAVGAAALLIAVLGTGLLAAGGLEEGEGLRLPAPEAAEAAAPSTTTTRPPPRPVTLVFAGDIHFEDSLAVRLRRDPATALAPARELLAGADAVVANLETAVTARGTRAEKQFAFRAPASAFVALREAGITVVSMANTHGLDYGPDGIADAMAAADAAGVELIGIGRDRAAALAPSVLDLDGARVAVFGATDVLDDDLAAEWTAGVDRPGMASAKDPRPLLAAIEAVRPTVDTVVVHLHWGVEAESCPSDRQRALAQRVVAAGADVVVGSHAHRLQGAGRHGDAFVAYGLGNFAFRAVSVLGAQSGALEVQVTGRRIESYRWRPATIDDSLPRPLRGAAADGAVRNWDRLRGCTDLAA